MRVHPPPHPRLPSVPGARGRCGRSTRAALPEWRGAARGAAAAGAGPEGAPAGKCPEEPVRGPPGPAPRAGLPARGLRKRLCSPSSVPGKGERRRALLGCCAAPPPLREPEKSSPGSPGGQDGAAGLRPRSHRLPGWALSTGFGWTGRGAFIPPPVPSGLGPAPWFAGRRETAREAGGGAGDRPTALPEHRASRIARGCVRGCEVEPPVPSPPSPASPGAGRAGQGAEPPLNRPSSPLLAVKQESGGSWRAARMGAGLRGIFQAPLVSFRGQRCRTGRAASEQGEVGV